MVDGDFARQSSLKPSNRAGFDAQWLRTAVRKDQSGYVSLDLEMPSFEEARAACDAVNARMDWTPEEADRIILASMGGGTA